MSAEKEEFHKEEEEEEEEGGEEEEKGDGRLKDTAAIRRKFDARNNPLYRTTAGQYGAKAADSRLINKPPQYNKTGIFTKSFNGFMSSDHSLNVSKTRSRVTKDPNFGIN